jgi:GDP-4-dehydro-6-deoxy-D-mannose reductase
MRCLITGGSGFVASHLFEYLSQKQDYQVFLGSRKHSNNFFHLDLKNFDESRESLLNYKFDKIFHLGFQSSVYTSFELPFETVYDNIVCTMNLLKICREQKNVKIVIAGTSEIYKSSEFALKETSEFDPRNPYTISKLAIDQFVRIMSKHLDMKITILRLFNHTGRNQNKRFVLASFAHQLAKIKLGLQEPIIKTGNLEIKRDFCDVKDVVKAYDLVSNSDSLYGEAFNVCSGTAFKLSDLLDKLIKISKVEVKIEQDPKLIRKNDSSCYYGSFKKIHDRFGWKPEISINKTLEDLYTGCFEDLQKECK